MFNIFKKKEVKKEVKVAREDKAHIMYWEANSTLNMCKDEELLRKAYKIRKILFGGAFAVNKMYIDFKKEELANEFLLYLKNSVNKVNAHIEKKHRVREERLIECMRKANE